MIHQLTSVDATVDLTGLTLRTDKSTVVTTIQKADRFLTATGDGTWVIGCDGGAAYTLSVNSEDSEEFRNDPRDAYQYDAPYVAQPGASLDRFEGILSIASLDVLGFVRGDRRLTRLYVDVDAERNAVLAQVEDLLAPWNTEDRDEEDVIKVLSGIEDFIDKVHVY